MTSGQGPVVRLALLDEVHALQQEILRPRGPLPGDVPPPPGARHVGAFVGPVEEAVTVAAASLVAAAWPGPGPVRPPAWQLRGVVVRQDHRGHGLGRRVVELAVATARASGAATLWAAARVDALGFYTGMGWTARGAVWDKPGVGPHRWVLWEYGSGCGAQPSGGLGYGAAQ